MSSVQASYNEGSSVIINCTASGTPDPDVRWMKNGIEKRSGKKTAFLTFSSINRADDGQYTCRANNSAGNDQKHVTLVVHCKKYVFSNYHTLTWKPGLHERCFSVVLILIWISRNFQWPVDQQFLEFPRKKGRFVRNTQIVERFLPGISVQSQNFRISRIKCSLFELEFSSFSAFLSA